MTLGRRDYWRAVALVFSGTAIAQMIPLLGSVIIARLYIPAEFGTFMTWLGLAALAGVFVTGRFEMALALEPDGLPRNQAATATFITTGLLLFALGLAGLIAWPFLSGWFPGIPSVLVALWGPAVAVLAAAQIWQAWAAAEGSFHALSAMRITQAAGITGLQIVAGIAAPSATTLALAHVAGVTVGLVMISRRLMPQRLTGGRNTLVRFWVRYRRFPIYALPADTINTAAGQLPLAILASRFGADVAGFVALAFRTLGSPISLLGSAVLDVFKRRASESWRASGSCRGPYIETLIVLASGSAVATIGFWLLGEDLFVLVFGENWREAGRIAVILLPLFAMRFVASPLSYTFYIAEKQHIDLAWQVCLLALTVATLLSFDTHLRTLAAYALGYGMLYAVYLVISFRVSAGDRT